MDMVAMQTRRRDRAFLDIRFALLNEADRVLMRAKYRDARNRRFSVDDSRYFTNAAIDVIWGI